MVSRHSHESLKYNGSMVSRHSHESLKYNGSIVLRHPHKSLKDKGSMVSRRPHFVISIAVKKESFMTVAEGGAALRQDAESLQHAINAGTYVLALRTTVGKGVIIEVVRIQLGRLSSLNQAAYNLLIRHDSPEL
jgi:hypothetical protein